MAESPTWTSRNDSTLFVLSSFRVHYITVLLAVILPLSLLAVYWLTRWWSGAGYVNERVERRFPPGPRGLPVIGSLHELWGDVFGKLRQFRDEYGDIYTIKLGPTRAVVLNSIDVIKEAFEEKAFDFGNRPIQMAQVTELTRGIVMSPAGAIHRQNRRYLSTGFSLIQLGNPEFSYHLHAHIDKLMSQLRQSNGAPVVFNDLTHEIVFFVFADLLLGEVPDTSSPQISKLLQVLYSTLTLNPMMVLAGKFVPDWIKAMAGNWINMPEQLSKVVQYLKEHIQQHRVKFNGTAFNLIDGFLVKEARFMEKNPDSTTEGDSSDTPPSRETISLADIDENEENWAAILTDAFQAGCTSVVALLQWTFLNVALHQDVQRRIQDEIDSALSEGGHRPSLQIRSSNFPVTISTILETLRLFPPAPLGAPHCAARDTKLANYDISRDTIILANIMMAQIDPDKWPDPEVFRIDRYLDDQGNLVNKDTIGFSAGPRTCPGKLLTMSIVSSFVVDVLQKFYIRLPDGQETFDHRGLPGIVYNPKTFSLVAEAREMKDS